MKSKGTFKFILAACACLAWNTSIAGTADAGTITITNIRTGWGSDSVAIESNQPIVNPANCYAPDAYFTQITEPGYKTHYAAILMAFSLGKPVRVFISDTECSSSRPKILGINVAK